MASINVLSWNIQKFGADKANDPNFCAYVAHVIRRSRADVVGLMEIVGQVGDVVVGKLLAVLRNADPDGGWEGAAGERTAAAPNEQYVLLWRTARVTVTDGPRLVRVLAGPAFDKFVDDHMIDNVPKLIDSLVAHKYVDGARTRLVVQRGYERLMAGQKLDLTTAQNKKRRYPLGAGARDELTRLLTRDEPQYFPQRKSRPPFVATIRPKNTGTDIRLAMLHAPKPGFDPPRAAMQLKLISGFEEANTAVAMGDFNLSEAESSATRALESFDGTRLAYLYDEHGQKVQVKAFQPLTSPDPEPSPEDERFQVSLGFEEHLGKEKTSLRKTIVADVIATTATLDQAKANAYDRFFVLAEGGRAGVYDALDFAVPKKWSEMADEDPEPRSETPTPHDPTLAKLAAAVHGGWWDRASAKLKGKKRKKRKGGDPEALLNELPKVPQVRSLREAQYTYLLAISDHLPIALELEYA